MFFCPVNEAPMVTRARGEFNLNTGIAKSNGIDASLFVRNMFNTRYLIDMNDLSALGFFFPVYNEPRSWGVTLSYKM
jgi:iron complex outermembrane receptor protein